MRSAAEYIGGPTRVVLANLVIDVREPALHGLERHSGYVGESSIGQSLPAYPVPEHFVRNHRPITARIAVMIFRAGPFLSVRPVTRVSLVWPTEIGPLGPLCSPMCPAGRTFVSEMSRATSKMSVDVRSDVRFVPLN